MRHHVPRVPDDEHVSHVGLGEPRGQHPRVHARHEHRGGVGVVTDPPELREHVLLPVRPVSHDAMQETPDTFTHPSNLKDLEIFVLLI